MSGSLFVSALALLFVSGKALDESTEMRLYLGPDEVPADELPEIMEFEEWSTVFGKLYADGEAERRRDLFASNLELIQRHNKLADAGLRSFRLGVNQFTDLSTTEFSELYLSSPYVPRAARGDTPETWLRAANVNASVDWRTSHAVTAIKNQGKCGACWAFTTTGAAEGAFAIATGDLRSLSEQQLIDCSRGPPYGNQGCDGGRADYGLRYVVANGGLDGEGEYWFKGADGNCWLNATKRHVAQIDSYTNVPPNDEAQLEQAVALGPVAVSIESNQVGFQSYRSGVFDAACGTRLDHGVLVVGYTPDYWIVKNSWGTVWGEKGYIRMKRGVSPQGICGIAMDPVYAIKAKGPAPPMPPPTPGALPCKCTAQCEASCNGMGMICCGNGKHCLCRREQDCPHCKPPGQDAHPASVILRAAGAGAGATV